jgi:hypothetical protein
MRNYCCQGIYKEFNVLVVFKVTKLIYNFIFLPFLLKDQSSLNTNHDATSTIFIRSKIILTDLKTLEKYINNINREDGTRQYSG